MIKGISIFKDAHSLKDVRAAKIIQICSLAQKIWLEIHIVYTKTLCLGAFSPRVDAFFIFSSST